MLRLRKEEIHKKEERKLQKLAVVERKYSRKKKDQGGRLLLRLAEVVGRKYIKRNAQKVAESYAREKKHVG